MSDLPSDIQTGSIHRDSSSPNADRPRGKPGQRDLTAGHIGRTLLAFALPTLGSNILQSLNGSINAIGVGRYLGEGALAATSNANIRNMTRFALEVAASAPSPRKRPTHTALIEPLSDWRMLPPSVGSANRTSVRVIGPRVRSWRPAARGGVAAGGAFMIDPCRAASP